MKKYELKDGGTIAAASPEVFITKLREGSKFDSDCTNEEYMTRFAERYKVQTAEVIISDDPITFISELVRVGYIKEVH